MRAIQLPDDVIEILKKGQFIVIDMGEFYCKMQKYDIDEQIQDEFAPPITVEFIPDQKIIEEYQRRRQE